MMTDTNTKVIRLPMPYKKQREILLDKHRFKVLNLGRRTGKSTIAATKAVLSAIETGYSSLIISGLLQPDYFRYDGTRS